NEGMVTAPIAQCAITSISAMRITRRSLHCSSAPTDHDSKPAGQESAGPKPGQVNPLFGLNTEFFDKLSPTLRLIHDEFGEIFRRRWSHFICVVCQNLLDFRILQRLDETAIEFLDAFRWCARGRQCTLPGNHLITRQTAFRDRRDIGKDMRPARCSHTY